MCGDSESMEHLNVLAAKISDAWEDYAKFR